MIVTALFLTWAIAFVPLDDRPVTRQLPQMLGRIAGVNVLEPPRELLGNYLTFGRPDAIIAWLNTTPQSASANFVISTDMLAYGGLVASRVPGTSYDDAYFRLRELQTLHVNRPHAWTGAFSTIMRLAPTGVPALGDAANFFAAYPQWSYLQQYANLHDPPLPSELGSAEHLRSLIAPGVLEAYLATRTRNYQVDRLAISYVRSGDVDRLALGQDDAGPVGLHVKDVLALQQAVRDDGVAARAGVEPGADELGMALVARAIALHARWTPHVAVRYSKPDGARFNDPLEFAPIDVAIGSLISLCGGVRDDGAPDITLYVRVPNDTPAEDAQLEEAMRADERAGRSVALADLTFLEKTYADQAAFAERLLNDGVAGGLDAYSSWNTNANTVGTAVAEAVVAGAGRRTGTYDALAHKTFTFNRIVDDYAFHDYVRPQLNALLDAAGTPDHTYLLPQQAAVTRDFNRAALWNRAAAILPLLYPGYHIAAMQISLPWNRTFETEIDAAIAP
ncbi:MAG TPA: DUF4127 family protein [Candidatus Baltobacteraceae bacterium]|jgi:hypothetical protein|nr:DUF4127 family protein [Candidatus Baltobacteraceae bacterium]